MYQASVSPEHCQSAMGAPECQGQVGEQMVALEKDEGPCLEDDD